MKPLELVKGTLDVLVLEHRHRETERLVGLTDNYLEVAFDGPDSLMRGFTRVRVTDADGAPLGGTHADHGEQDEQGDERRA